MFCSTCGTELPANAVACPHCAAPVNFAQPNVQQQQPPYTNNPYNGAPPYGQVPQQPWGGAPYTDNAPASTGLKVLSFFIPIVGIVLFFVDRNNKPQSAKDCLKFALISIGISVLLSFGWMLLAVCLASAYM